MHREHLFIVHIFVLAPLIALLCFYNLDSGANFGTGTGIDESWYIQVTQEIKESAKWWMPTREGEPFFYKPPLKFWISALVSNLIGESIISYRLIDAFEGTIIVISAYLVGAALFSNINAGFFASLTLLSCWAFLFANGLRFAALDIQLMFFCIPAMLILFFQSERAKSTKVWVGLLVGFLVSFAVLTKSVVGYLPFGVHFAWLILSGKFKTDIRSKKIFYLTAIVTSVIIPAFWFVPHMLLTEGAFERMVGYEIVSRFENGFHNKDDLLFYLKKFFAGKFTPILLTGAALLYFLVKHARNSKILFFLVWIALPFAVFSILPSRLVWYMHPILFPCAVIIGGFLSILIDNFTKTKNMKLKVLYLFLIAIGLLEEIVFLQRNIEKVIVPSPRIEIDEVVHRALDLYPGIRGYEYDSVDLATRERIFANLVRTRRISTLDSIKDSPYLLFTRADQIPKIEFDYYKELNPVEFNQGPQGILRKQPLLLILGGIKGTETLEGFESRKVVFRLSESGCVKGQVFGEVRKAKEPLITCTFKGSSFFQNVNTRFAIDIGRTTRSSEPVQLEIYGNFHKIGSVPLTKSNLNKYEFDVPKGTWIKSENEIFIILKDRNGNPSRERLFFNWALIELKR